MNAGTNHITCNVKIVHTLLVLLQIAVDTNAAVKCRTFLCDAVSSLCLHTCQIEARTAAHGEALSWL